jgi:hypothetical protein
VMSQASLAMGGFISHIPAGGAPHETGELHATGGAKQNSSVSHKLWGRKVVQPTHCPGGCNKAKGYKTQSPTLAERQGFQQRPKGGHDVASDGSWTHCKQFWPGSTRATDTCRTFHLTALISYGCLVPQQRATMGFV